MAGSVPTLYWFDRWDERIGLLCVVGELVHTEELNGEDSPSRPARRRRLSSPPPSRPGNPRWMRSTAER